MIEVFPSGPFATNAYVVYCERSKKAGVIDPAPESAESLLHFLNKNKLNLDKVILTHSHWDHFGDLKKVLNEKSAPVYIHEADKQNLIEPGSDGLPLFVPISKVQPNHFIKEGDELDIGEIHFKVMHTPGHSPGGVCLYSKESNVLFSGDTLFKGSIGNLSFPTAEPDKMWESLERLATLPGETRVYPGHGEMTAIQDESWLKNAKHIFN